MRILQATIRYFPAVGGVEEYVKRISEGSVKFGNEVCVFTSDLAQHTDKLVKLKNNIQNINGVRIIRNYSFPVKLKHYPVMPLLPLRILLKKFDLIHGHCFMSFPMDISGLASIIGKVPFVFNPYFTEIGFSSGLGRLYRATLGKLAMKAGVVVVISEFEKRLIERSGYRVKRLEIVPPGVDNEEFDSVTYNVYNKYLETKNKKIILFVGRIDHNKGVDTLIKASVSVLKKEPDTVFFLAGPDFGEMKNLKAMAEELGVAKSFIFSGQLERPDLVSAFKNADIFAFPSRYEAFGITLIEAMIAGKPVVANDCSAISFVIKHNKNGLLFPYDNWLALSDILVSLLKDENMRKEIAKKGCLDTKEKYSWQKTISAIVSIYNSLVRG